jgi:hypothetical protein
MEPAIPDRLPEAFLNKEQPKWAGLQAAHVPGMVLLPETALLCKRPPEMPE